MLVFLGRAFRAHGGVGVARLWELGFKAKPIVLWKGNCLEQTVMLILGNLIGNLVGLKELVSHLPNDRRVEDLVAVRS